ncbi:hypothetical protein [Bradyrhizobium sp. 23AC]
MTLIVAAGNAKYAVVAADTRLSWDGKLVDDASAKLAHLKFHDGTLITAYTGLARWGSFQTRKWLRETLYRVAEPSKTTMEVLSLLRAEITRGFANNAAIATLTPHQRKLTIVFTGFVNESLVTAWISNFQGKMACFLRSLTILLSRKSWQLTPPGRSVASSARSPQSPTTISQS